MTAQKSDLSSSELTPAQRREAFERAYWDWAEYLTRKAQEKATQEGKC